MFNYREGWGRNQNDLIYDRRMNQVLAFGSPLVGLVTTSLVQVWLNWYNQSEYTNICFLTLKIVQLMCWFRQCILSLPTHVRLSWAVKVNALVFVVANNLVWFSSSFADATSQEYFLYPATSVWDVFIFVRFSFCSLWPSDETCDDHRNHFLVSLFHVTFHLKPLFGVHHHLLI